MNVKYTCGSLDLLIHNFYPTKDERSMVPFVSKLLSTKNGTSPAGLGWHLKTLWFLSWKKHWMQAVYVPRSGIWLCLLFRKERTVIANLADRKLLLSFENILNRTSKVPKSGANVKQVFSPRILHYSLDVWGIKSPCDTSVVTLFLHIVMHVTKFPYSLNFLILYFTLHFSCRIVCL